MELQVDQSDDTPSVNGPYLEEPSTPLRKRQRQSIQDPSVAKTITPVRASGRIRIKMTAAAELKTPEPAVKSVKILNANINSKQRRRPKKLKSDVINELVIDVKRPSSVLVDTSIRALLTNAAFSQLSVESQKILIESLPLVDRPIASSIETQSIELNLSSINNEFFNRACIEWRDRLSNGEFTNEHQTKLRAEQEREKSKIDPWKARNFEGIWGIKSNGHGHTNVGAMMEKSALEMKEMVEQGDFEIPEGFISEVWSREAAEDNENDSKMNDMEWEQTSSSFPLSSPKTNSICNTPSTADVVTSSQQESPKRSPCRVRIVEATSSADNDLVDEKYYEREILSSPISAELDNSPNDFESSIELSNDGITTKWFHQQEHDYLKNEQEPEPSGLEEAEPLYENCILDGSKEEEEEDDEDLPEEAEEVPENVCINDVDALPLVTSNITSIDHDSHINSYDSELPQDIFHNPEIETPSLQANTSRILYNNYIHSQDASPVVVRQILDTTAAKLSSPIILQDDHRESPKYHENFVMEEAEAEDSLAYHEEIRMNNVQKSVKLLAFPSRVKYNNIAVEETSHNVQHQHTHQIPSFRTNGTSAMQPSYFLGSTNIAYISKMGNKTEVVDSTRLLKQEANNNQSALKQRIIYEIASEANTTYEQPSTHHITYSSQPRQEVFHQMVKHPNGTTTIYETTNPAAKKTIIQRKKTVDPYTVQLVANNNTIILTPIGNPSSQQTIQQQPQKSILHIHRSAPLIQTNSPPVHFLTAPQTFLKKQTIIHPQMPQKTTNNYTTVIRTPSAPAHIPQHIVTTTISSKIQRPIQKQKVIMSTSSLQQYRSYNQKSPAGHGSRKQLHPQHIVRPAPCSTATATVIQQQIPQESKPNQIPVLLPSNNNDHMIMSTPITINSNQIPSSPMVIGPPTGVNNIYVRPKRPQQIFHATNPMNNPMNIPMNNPMNNVNTIMNLTNLNNQQIMASGQPRMRHQPINQRPPPGTVNLERSYQICQAVIQNSTNPNRHQLNNQLKPPPSNIMVPKKFS